MSLALNASRAVLNPGAWVRNELWRRARAVPSLDLRFAESKSLVDATTGQSLVTFTRASSGTFVGSDGLIKTATTNEPRFDHNPTTGESLGLLMEEQRTNLFLRSEEFDNASWAFTAGANTITANNVTAPNGTTTADTVAGDGTNAAHFVSQSVTVTAVSYTWSVFAKKNTEDVVHLRAFSALGGANVGFNLTSGTVVAQSSATGSIVAYPNGWYRCIMTWTPTAATGGLGIYVRDIVSNTASGSLFLWGAQLETGAFPTSYIPTTTATVTRSADVASITGTAFSSWYRQDEGTVFASATRATTPANTVWFATVNDGTSNNRIQFGYGDSSGNYAVLVSNLVTGQAYPAVSSTTRSAAFSYGANGGVSYNGLTASSVTITSLPTVDRMSIGSFVAAGSGYINGTIRRLTYWPQRLPNSTLQTLTQ